MNKKIKALSTIVVSSLILSSCGGGAKDKNAQLKDLNVKLENLKVKKNNIETDIRKTEEEINKLDPSNAAKNAKLVAVAPVSVDSSFAHYIELQGKINTDDGVAYVAPKGQGGLVKAVLVKPGQKVGKGQLVAKLDDAIPRQQLATARQQVGVIKAQMDLAKTTYERYQNLWSQNIGAEMQVVKAKADFEAATAQYNAALSNVGTAQEAVNMSNVYAGISGTVEQVNVRPGEFFTGVSADRKPQILIVNDNASMKAEVPVPDRYAKDVVKGAKVLIDVPDLDTTFKASITMVGASIDATTRSFMAEAKLGINKKLKPNLTAVIRIQDNLLKNVVVVPVNLVQTDEGGKFVYIMIKEGDKLVARKKTVTVQGEPYKGQVAIASGLSGSDMIITDGYQTVYDGQLITTAASN
ncbi:MAG: efflux RND transporter periplasmic adaptor subunit [Bacteroidetes bacterium]|nr:efflux RND transporter periplasmic adaptor subunit [Bacteroidota bacterium]